MAKKGYIGKSDSDRAFDKVEKFMKYSKTLSDGNKPLNEQIDYYNNNKFLILYPNFGSYMKAVDEQFLKIYNVSIETASRHFTTNYKNILRECYAKHIKTSNVAIRLANVCSAL